MRARVERATSVERFTVERLGWGGVGIARTASGKLVLLSASLALFPGEVVEARVEWRGRHGDGAVFLRDLNRLARAFEIRKLAAIDLFPMTTEVEFVGLLERKR